MFGKTEVGGLGVTVVPRLKEKNLYIEWENTKAG